MSNLLPENNPLSKYGRSAEGEILDSKKPELAKVDLQPVALNPKASQALDIVVIDYPELTDFAIEALDDKDFISAANTYGGITESIQGIYSLLTKRAYEVQSQQNNQAVDDFLTPQGIKQAILKGQQEANSRTEAEINRFRQRIIDHYGLPNF